MNKKFFTLLVAFLATIGFGAFAQVTVGNVIKANGTLNDRYESEKFYLLQTKAKNYLTVVDGELVTITFAELENSTYSELQAAMWTVTATPGVTGGSSPTNATYEYVNAAFGIKLSLATANATLATQPMPPTGSGKNALGGDLEKWIASTNMVDPQIPNYFYVTNTLQQVITMSAKADGEVIPVTYTNLPALDGAVVAAGASGNITALDAATTAVSDAQDDLDAFGDARVSMAALNSAIAALDLSNATAVSDLNTAATDFATELAALSPAVALTPTAVVVDDQPSLDALKGEIEAVVADIDTAEDDAETALADAKEILADAAAVVDDVLVITPKFAGGNIILSANDINTYLKKQGVYETNDFYATEDSYFDLNMSETNTLSNPFEDELQALAVFYVPTGNALSATKIGDTWYSPVVLQKKADSGYRDITQPWVALTDKDGKFLVVDTAYITGTDQVGTGLLQTKAVDGFWSAANNNGRMLDSYLYQFTYNGSDNSVSIAVRAYLNERTVPEPADPAKVQTWKPEDADISSTGNAYFYGYQYDPGTGFRDMNYLTNATLAYQDDIKAVVYTWGQEDMKIDLNIGSKYVAGRVQTGVYLLKVTGSTDSRNIGKYLKKSLDGVTEYVEQATRQNFQHMPSAQWVIESTNVNTATITNREFSDVYNSGNRTWITYKTTKDNEFFFLGEDTLQYIPVTNITDKKQGYKFVDNGDLSYLNNFEFRYLHELAMDRPVFMKDGERMPLFVNSVDADAAKFRLEEVILDDYGYTTTNIPTLAKLERSVYRVATFDPIDYLIDDTKYYVTYDGQEKQYFLMTEEELDADPDYAPSLFFLKENNEVPATADVEAICYYTFLDANVDEYYYALGRNYASLKRREDNSLNEYIVDKLFKGGFVYDADLDGSKLYVLTDKDGKPYTYETDAAATAAKINFGINNNVYFFNFFDDVTDLYYIRYYAGRYYNPIEEAWEGPYAWTSTAYATSKVSVDNNTLAWTYGELPDNKEAEVANSAFKVEPNDNIIYRTIGHEEDETLDSLQQQNIRIYRVNATAREYLYEDANSVYSVAEGPNKPSDDRLGIKDQINFLGVEGKGDTVFNKAPIIARYVRGTIMPQYLLMLDYKTIKPVEDRCPECLALEAAGLPVPENCPHDINTPGYSTARVLVSLVDSIASYDKTEDKNVFRWNNQPRLAFVDAYFTHGDAQKDSIMTIVRKLPDTVDASDKFITRFKQTAPEGQVPEVKQEGTHKPVFFSFRLIEEGNKEFMIESAGLIGGKENNSWVKVQNGVPVLVNTTFDDAYNGQAEIFDLEATDDAATSNEGIEAGQVQVIAGQGSVTIKGAAGQQVAITNILGQSIYNGIVASDEVTVAAPAGVVVVSVAGEATKALVK